MAPDLPGHGLAAKKGPIKKTSCEGQDRMDELIAGYRAFRQGRYTEDAALYRRLGERGQRPHTMVVACCDSRVDPATIFSAGPGQLFVLRNVANLVPPWNENGGEMSTGAAIEFAVIVLGVRQILVMGHGDCGGVKAALAASVDGARPDPTTPHTAQWIEPVTELCRHHRDRLAGIAPEERNAFIELETVRASLANLMTIPAVRERVAAGALALRGAHFGIASGRLLTHDPATGAFVPPA